MMMMMMMMMEIEFRAFQVAFDRDRVREDTIEVSGVIIKTRPTGKLHDWWSVEWKLKGDSPVTPSCPFFLPMTAEKKLFLSHPDEILSVSHSSNLAAPSITSLQ